MRSTAFECSSEVRALIPLDAHAPRWPELSALLDAALDVPACERGTWLASLSGEHAELRATLQELLDALARAEANEFLQGLPRLPQRP